MYIYLKLFHITLSKLFDIYSCDDILSLIDISAYLFLYCTKMPAHRLALNTQKFYFFITIKTSRITSA